MGTPARVIIVGAGFAGIYAYHELTQQLPSQLIDITVIDPRANFEFTPLLHEVATNGIKSEHILEPYSEIVSRPNSRHLRDTVVGIDTSKQVVTTNNAKLEYDYLVIATGSKSNIPTHFQQHVRELKNIDDSLSILYTLSKEETRSVIVVGAGHTGIETAAEIAKSRKLDQLEVTLVESGSEILPRLRSDQQRGMIVSKLENLGIELLCNYSVSELSQSTVKFGNQEERRADLIIWTAGVQPSYPEITPELETDFSNRILVDDHLRVPDSQNVFVVGDISNIQYESLPQTGQQATQAGKYAGKAISNMILGKRMEKYNYKYYGYLVSLGRWDAVGEVIGIQLSGVIAWVVWRTAYFFKFLSLRKKVVLSWVWTKNAVLGN